MKGRDSILRRLCFRASAPGIVSALVALVFLGCAPLPKPVPLTPKTLGDWRDALTELRALSASMGPHEERGSDAPSPPETRTASEPHPAAAPARPPYTFKLSMALREPYTGRRTEARGAVALSPEHRAVRMILVGPGGTTAFDLWIKADAFRVAIPAIDLLRRGDASTPRAERRGLPVDFLRWWLLDPTRGDLLWFERSAQKTTYALREGEAVTSLDVLAGDGFEAIRQTWSPSIQADPARRIAASPRLLLDEEKVTADKLGCGHARYTQASTGVEIEITCDGIEPNPPSERAFVDPDAPEPEENE